MIFYKLDFGTIKNPEYGMADTLDELCLRLYSAKGANPHDLIFAIPANIIVLDDTTSDKVDDPLTVQEALNRASHLVVAGND